MDSRTLRFPWRDYQRFCLGALGWTPQAFWQATAWEVAEAYEGYALKHGINRVPKTSLTAEDILEIEEWEARVSGNAR